MRVNFGIISGMAGSEVINPPACLPNDTEKLYYGQLTPRDAVLGYISRFLEVDQNLDPLNYQITRPAIAIDLASQEILRKAGAIQNIDSRNPQPLPIILVTDGIEINQQRPIVIKKGKPCRHNKTKDYTPRVTLTLSQVLPTLPAENTELEFSVWGGQSHCCLMPKNTSDSPPVLPFGLLGNQEAVLLLTARQQESGQVSISSQSLSLPKGLLETTLPPTQLRVPESQPKTPTPVIIPTTNEEKRLPYPVQRIVTEISQEMIRAGVLENSRQVSPENISYQEYPIANNFLGLKGGGFFPLSFIVVTNPKEIMDKPKIGLKPTKIELSSGKTLRTMKLDLSQMFTGLPPEPEFTVFGGPFLKPHHNQNQTNIIYHKQTIPANLQNNDFKKGCVLLVWQDKTLHVSGLVLPIDIIDKAFK